MVRLSFAERLFLKACYGLNSKLLFLMIQVATVRPAVVFQALKSHRAWQDPSCRSTLLARLTKISSVDILHSANQRRARVVEALVLIGGEQYDDLWDYTFLGGTNGTAQWVQQEILRVEHQKCLDLRNTLKQNISEDVEWHKDKQPRKM